MMDDLINDKAFQHYYVFVHNNDQVQLELNDHVQNFQCINGVRLLFHNKNVDQLILNEFEE
jgi:hypothetical protein